MTSSEKIKKEIKEIQTKIEKLDQEIKLRDFIINAYINKAKRILQQIKFV